MPRLGVCTMSVSDQPFGVHLDPKKRIATRGTRSTPEFTYADEEAWQIFTRLLDAVPNSIPGEELAQQIRPLAPPDQGMFASFVKKLDRDFTQWLGLNIERESGAFRVID